MTDPPLIIAALRKMTAVALAEIDPSGCLRDANAGFIRLLPNAMSAELEPNVARYFLSPRFNQLVELSFSGRQPVYDGIITIGDGTGRSRSLRGTVSLCGQSLVLVAEVEIEELESAYEKAIQLTHELAKAQRELLSAHNKLKRHEAVMVALSETDQLTGLANRRKLDHVLVSECARARRYGSKFTLVITDLDHFKRINDEFGHDVGDLALSTFAHLLQAQIRETDLAARYGGEEFVLLLSHTDAEEAGKCVERIRTQLAQATIPAITRPVTASFGVTVIRPDDNAISLFQRADRALYEAKELGRNRVVVA